MSRLLERMDWYKISYNARLWIVWFLLLVGIATPLDIIVPKTYEPSWVQWLAFAIVCLLASRCINGASKKESKRGGR